MGDTLGLSGILRIYEIPDELLDGKEWGRLTLKEKDREGKLVVEARNMIMSAGRTQILSFIGASGATSSFAQYYAVGTGTIYTVNTGDNSLASELFRAVPNSFSIVGNAVTISTSFSGSQGNGTLTNSGIFGNNATSTPGSGTLFTHLLYSYVKPSGLAVINDYTITLA